MLAAKQSCVAATKEPSRTWPLVRGGEIQVRHYLASTDMRLGIEWALAGLGIAMANAMDSARAAADRVIGDQDSDTIADLIDELFFA